MIPILLAALTGFIVNLLSFSEGNVVVPPLKMSLADYPGSVTVMDTTFPGLDGNLSGFYENYRDIVRDAESEVREQKIRRRKPPAKIQNFPQIANTDNMTSYILENSATMGIENYGRTFVTGLSAMNYR